ncbi:MAG: hypothetical protein V3U98_00240 [Acidobacteriota bacterium]
MSRAALRLVILEESEVQQAAPQVRQGGSMRCTYKAPGDDFFCWKFQLWYPSIDCAYRNLYQTCAPCADCAQGRRNLERRGVDLARRRWIGDPQL